ncbi:unnamed protein product, partial [marine sediment metagenome]
MKYTVGGKNGKLTWDIDGNEYAFTYVGETLSRSARGAGYSVIYGGEGSYLFEVQLLSDNGYTIEKNNFIVVYVLGNLDSVDWVAYYAEKKGLDIINTADPNVSASVNSG